MELEEAKVILEDLSLVYEQQSILMPEYKKSSLSNKEAIETVLQEYEKLNTDNYYLRNYLGEQGMISDYMKFKMSKKK